MENFKKILQKKVVLIKRKIERLELKHGDNPGQTHTYHGGWDMGYWKGRLSAFEEMIDELDEMEES